LKQSIRRQNDWCFSAKSRSQSFSIRLKKFAGKFGRLNHDL